MRRALLAIGLALVTGCSPSADSRKAVVEEGASAPDTDYWRYVPDDGTREPAAEMVLWNSGSLVFRITCDQDAKELAFEYFGVNYNEVPPAQYVSQGIDLILQQAGPGFEQKGYKARGPITGDVLTGRLKVDEMLAFEIEQAPTILLYAENGPTNDYYGGPAKALRRVARECVT